MTGPRSLSGGIDRSKGDKARQPADLAAATPPGGDNDPTYAPPHFWPPSCWPAIPTDLRCPKQHGGAQLVECVEPATTHLDHLVQQPAANPFRRCVSLTHPTLLCLRSIESNASCSVVGRSTIRDTGMFRMAQERERSRSICPKEGVIRNGPRDGGSIRLALGLGGGGLRGMQLDLRAGFGLSGRPDDFFTGAGYSVRC